MQRICIYSQDIIFITGRSGNYARDILRDIKLLLNKERYQLVTIQEFCDYMGLPFDEVFNMINGLK